MRATYIILTIILLASLFLRIDLALHCHTVPDYSDMAKYNEAAIGNKIIPSSVPPGYPLFLRFIYRLFGNNNYRAVYIIQSIISVFSVFMIFWIAKKTFNERVGLIAAGIASVYPNFIFYNCIIITESTALFLFLIILAIYFLPIKEKTRSILASIAILIAYPLRPVFIFFTPALFIALKKKTIFALSLLLLFSPLIIYSTINGNKGAVRAARAFYRSFNEKSVGSVRIKIEDTKLGRANLPASVYFKEGLRFIRNNKWNAINIIYNKAEIIFNKGWDDFVLKKAIGDSKNLYNILTYAYLPIMFLGFLGIFRYTNRKNWIFLLAIGSYLFIIVVFFIFKTRYRLLIEPVLVIFTAAVIDSFLSKIKGFIKKAAKFYKNTSQIDISIEDSFPAQKRPIVKYYKTYWDTLLIIIMLAAFVRLYPIHYYSSAPTIPEQKAVNSLAISGKFTTSTPPLYPLFVKSVYSIAGVNNYRWVYIIQSIISIITILLIFGVMAKVFNKNAAFIAAIICSLYPRFIFYNLNLAPITFSIFIVSSLMLVSLVSIGESHRSIISAALCASGVLISPTLLWLIPGTFFILKKKRVFLIFLILFLMPYTLINFFKYHKLVPVYDKWVYKVSLKAFKDANYFWHPIEKIYLNYYLLRNMGRASNIATSTTFIAAYMYSTILALGTIGLFRYYKNKQRNILFPTLFFLAIIMFFSDIKITEMAIVEPLLIIYTSVLAAKALDWLAQIPKKIKPAITKNDSIIADSKT